MDYDIEKIDSRELKQLYTILNDIYCKFIIDEDFTDLRYGVPKGLNRVSAEDQKEIIAELIWKKVLIGYYKDVEYIQSEDYPEGYYDGGYILDFTQEFLDLYVEVKRKIREQDKPTFDENFGILSFKKYKIKIVKQKKNTQAKELLIYLIDNNYHAYYAEMEDYFSGQEERYKEHKIGKKYYNICKEIQDKVKEQTNGEIDDFLIFNNKQQGEAKVNPKYL